MLAFVFCFLQQREKETGICSICLLLKEQGSIRSITAVISMRSMSPIFAEKSRRRGYFIHVIFVKAADFILLPKGRIPVVEDVVDFYRLAVIKKENRIEFTINELSIFTYIDDGITCGALLDGGKIGFRQLAPLTAEYRNLRVYQIK